MVEVFPVQRYTCSAYLRACSAYLRAYIAERQNCPQSRKRGMYI